MRRTCWISVALNVALVATVVHADDPAFITSISPQRGSIAGGTKVTIKGGGFGRDGVDGFTRVYIGNDICRIEEYYSSDQQIVCYTPRSNGDDDRIVSITVDRIGGQMSKGAAATCTTSCMFYTRTGYTPYMYEHNFGGVPGSKFAANGIWRMSDVDLYEATIGGMQCDWDAGHVASNGWIDCVTGHVQSGQYNVSMRIDHESYGYGNPERSFGIGQVDLSTDTPFEYTVHPFVTNINHHVTGVNGGADMELEGYGFSYDINETKVFLDGEECIVTSIIAPAEEDHAQTINCITSASTLTDFDSSASAGLGMRVRTFEGRYYHYSSVEDMVPTQTLLQTAQFSGGLYGRDNLPASSTELIDGYFVPPVSGEYSWYMMADDYGSIWVSSNESASGLPENPDASCTYTGSFFVSDDQISRPRYYEAGKRYLVKAIHGNGGGGSNLKVGVRAVGAAANTTLAKELVSLREYQEIALKTNVSRETQVIRLHGVKGGSFHLTRRNDFVYPQFNVNLTKSSNNEVLAILRNAAQRLTAESPADSDSNPACTNIDVSRQDLMDHGIISGIQFTFVFNCPTTQPYPLLDVFERDNNPVWDPIVNTTISIEAGIVTRKASAPIRGDFKVCLPTSVCTNPMSFNTNPSTVASALNELTGIEKADVSRSGNVHDSMTFLITMFRPAGDFPQLSIDISGLTGTDLTMTAKTLQNGSADDVFYARAPMDWFELPSLGVLQRHENDTVSLGRSVGGTVRAYSNGLLAVCDIASESEGINACAFEYRMDITPYISSVSPSSAQVGDSLTLTGKNFIPDRIDDHVIHVGEGECKPTFVDETTIVCELLDTNAGTHKVSLSVSEGRGVATVEDIGTQVTVEMNIFSVSPLAGSFAGGTPLTIEGTGFSVVNNGAENVINFLFGDQNTKKCAVIEASHRHLICRTPEDASYDYPSRSYNFTVNGYQHDEMFIYKQSLTPTMSYVDPTFMSYAVSGVVEFGVSGMDVSDNITVDIGGRECLKPTVDIAAETVRCVLLRASPPPLPHTPIKPNVYVGEKGLAKTTQTITMSLTVSALSHHEGSLYGGQNLVISGNGFGSDKDRVEVKVMLDTGDWVLCDLESVSQTSISCVTPPTLQYLPDNATQTIATVQVEVGRLAARCGESPHKCRITLAQQYSASCTRLSTTTGTPSNYLYIYGENFEDGSVTIAVDGENCLSSSMNTTSAKCQLPHQVAGHHNISIVNDMGRAYCPLAIKYQLSVSGISESAGSVVGGHELEVTGTGFSKNSNQNVVTFGDVVADVLSSSFTTVRVRTRDNSVSGTVSVDASVVHRSPDGLSENDEVIDSVNDFATYTFSSALTPEITSVSRTTVSVGNDIVIYGVFPKSEPSNSRVVIGDQDCVKGSGWMWSNTSIHCEVGKSMAGTHDVRVFVGDRGLAKASNPVQVIIALKLNNVDKQTGGVAGGARLTLTGSGFPELGSLPLSASSASGFYGQTECPNRVPNVTICNAECKLESVTANEIVCQTSSIVTRTGLRTMGHYYPVPITPVAYDPPYSSMVYDGDLVTPYYGKNTAIDVGETNSVIVTRIRFFPRFRYSDSLLNGRFEGSNDSETWNLIAELTTRVNEGWNNVFVNQEDVADAPAYRFLRFVASGPYSLLNEVQYFGHILPFTNSDGECDIRVQFQCDPSEPIVEDSLPDGFVYSETLTPVVDNISPDNGTSSGGTIVSIRGSGFGTDLNAVNVKFNGVTCDVSAVTNDKIVCTTRKRDEIRPHSVEVYVESAGLASVVGASTRFRYLDRWSELATWAFGEPPGFNDTVSIPRGQSVLLDVSTPILYLVLIEGELIFADMDLTFDAHYVLVQGGRLEVGTEDKPYLNKAVITLHGDRWKNVQLPLAGGKMIAIRDVNGRSFFGDGDPNKPTYEAYLEVHGRPRKRTWTKINADIPVGASIVRTSEEVDYEPGEIIIVTSSSTNFRETEERIVSRVISSTEFEVSEPFKYLHRAQIFPAGQYGHSDVDMRAEVALISRNIVIQGDEKSDQQLYGVHTMALHGGTYHIENAEVRRCGQGFHLGRYCTHSHLSGELSKSYVKSNSIHHGYQRASTIHGTHYYTVSHNVAYHVRGHNYFVEDGAEHFNVIEGNLAAWTLKSAASLKSDLKPASFWMASPKQFWRHNVAAGCTNDGFWFELPGHPHGPSYSTDVCPVHDPLGEFFNNTAHSNGVHGLRIYPVYLPLVDPCDANSGPSPQYFYNFTSYRNGQHGIFGKENGDLHHVNAKLVENSYDDQRWVKLKHVDYRLNDPHILNGLFVGHTDPNHVVGGKRALFAPQDEYFHVRGAQFVNYHNTGAIAGCAKCDDDTEMKQGGFTFRFEGLNFHNSPKRTLWTPPYKQIFWDMDGSLTGFVNGTVMPYYAFNENDNCLKTDDVYDTGIRCNGQVRVRRLQIDGHSPRELDWKYFVIRQEQNASRIDRIAYRAKEFSGWAIPIVNTGHYDIFPDSIIDWRTLQMRYSEPVYVLDDEWLALRLNWTDYRYSNKVTYAKDTEYAHVMPELPDIGEGARAPLPTDPIGTGWIERRNEEGWKNNTWRVILNDVNTTAPGRYDTHRLWIDNIQCPPRGCPVPGEGQLDGYLYKWSDPTTWPNNRLPQEGEDVEIPPTKHIQVDIETPHVATVSVLGKLSAADGGVLNANNMIVWGILEIGTPEKPFTGTAKIRMHGVRDTPNAPIDNNLFLGNKVIAVLGNATMVGRPKTSWTRLSATAAAGSTQLHLEDSPLGWMAGDRISVSATEYNISEIETRVIQSVSGKIVTLTQPLSHRHFGEVQTYNGETIQMAAAVANLDRNIVVEGVITEENQASGRPGYANYGMHWVVSEIYRLEGENNMPVRRVGHANIQDVQMENCGQQQMEHGCFLFRYPLTNPQRRNVLNNVVMADSLNYGIVAEYAGNVDITNNVIHRAFRTAIDFYDRESDGAIIRGNLISGVFRSPDETDLWIRPTAGIYMNSIPSEISDNFISGSSDSGITLRPEKCISSSERATVFGNEVAASKIGVFILSVRSPSDCVMLRSFKAWKIAHIGILSVDQRTNVRLDQVVVADSHIGVSLNYFRTARKSYSEITNSFILGSTSGSTCDASLTCLADTDGDVAGANCNSVFGTGYRRVGIISSQYTNRPKTCELDGGLTVCRPPNTVERLCSLPWENRYGLPSTRQAETIIRNVVFGDFTSNDCGLRSAAVAHNPTQIDFGVPTKMSQITWQNVDMDAKFSFRKTSLTLGDCVASGCDGFNFLMFTDEDGTMHGNAGGTMIYHNPGLSLPSPGCTDVAEYEGIWCPQLHLQGLVYEAMGRDRSHQRLGPLMAAFQNDLDVSNQDGTERVYSSIGPIDDHCAMRFHFAQFPFSVQPGETHHMQLSNTQDAHMRFTYFSEDPSDAVVMAIFLQNPNVVDIYIDGKKHAPLDPPREPTVNDPQGSHIFNPQLRHLYLTIRGSPSIVQIDVMRTARVQLNVDIQISSDEFWEGSGQRSLINNLAILLGIDQSRIHVVERVDDPFSQLRRLQSSSGDGIVRISIFIDPAEEVIVGNSYDGMDSDAVVGNQTVTGNYEQVVAAQRAIASRIDSSFLDGFTVTKAEMITPSAAASDEKDGDVTNLLPNDSNGFPLGAIIGIAAGGAVLVAAGAVVTYKIHERHARRRNLAKTHFDDIGQHRERVPSLARRDVEHNYTNPQWRARMALQEHSMKSDLDRTRVVMAPQSVRGKLNSSS